MKHLHTFESFLNEAKLELNKTIPTSTKEYTWIYQTGKDSIKTAAEINKKLNKIGIKSFISKFTGDTICIPTIDLEKAFDEVISGYDNMKQFAYNDRTKINKTIVNESYGFTDTREINEAVEYSVGDFPIGADVTIGDEVWKVVKPGTRGEKIFMAPFNAEAKRKYISIAIEFDINWLNANITNISK